VLNVCNFPPGAATANGKISLRQRKDTLQHRFMHDGDTESYAFAPESPVRDVHDSKPHGYRYSRDGCSAETCISCRQPKSLAFLASLLLLDKSRNRKAVKVSCLRPGPKDF
jgi:hypothetical protein